MSETKIKFKKFRADLHGFNYYFEDEVLAGAEVILCIPPITANKRSVNDVGWMVECDNDVDVENVVVSGTLSSNPRDDSAIWQELTPGEDVNKTLSGIKIRNNSANSCKVCIRVILC